MSLPIGAYKVDGDGFRTLFGFVMNAHGDIDSPNNPSVLFQDQEEEFRLIEDLLGGTRAMRRNASAYLPQEDRESVRKYENRLAVAFLTDFFADTVREIAALPFGEPVVVEGLPEPWEYLRDDVDGTGRSMTEHAYECYLDMTTWGMTHLITDFTRLPENATAASLEGLVSRAEEAQRGARPLLLRHAPNTVIGWRQQGNELAQLRIREMRVLDKPGTTWLDEKRTFVRVWNRDSFAEFMMKADDPLKVDSADIVMLAKPFPEIPHVPAYWNRTGFLQATPPLRGLAEANLEHFQLNAGVRNVLRVASFAILFLKGWKQPKGDREIELSPTKTLSTSNPQGDAKYIEHTGAAVASMHKQIELVELRGERLGAHPLAREGGRKTATGVAADEARNISEAEAAVRRLERALTRQLAFAFRWKNEEPPADLRVRISDQLTQVDKSVERLRLKMEATLQGLFPVEEWLKALQQAGDIEEEADIEVMARQLRDRIQEGLDAITEDDEPPPAPDDQEDE